MIDPTSYPFYLIYAAITIVVFLVYLQVRSTEAIIITTKEFRRFQSSYLTGYSLSLLGELASNAFFFYIFSAYKTERAVFLYLVSIVSTVCFSILFEIIDIGSRKNKAILSSFLYTLSMLTILSGDDKDVLFIGRILYGAASAYHHSSCESYVVHEHGSLGFPDEWLAQTFALLTHIMALLGWLVGTGGQIVSSYVGTSGVVCLCSVLFGASGMYVMLFWTRDISTSKFLFGSFFSNMAQTIIATRKSKQLALFILISLFAETSFTIFSYYWAQLITSLQKEEEASVPYALIFSCYICASMLGAYTHTLYAVKIGPDIFFQGVLSGLVASFSLASMVQTPLVVFLSSLVVYGFMGAYWPCIGTLRGKAVGGEQRNASQIISRSISTIFTVCILLKFQHSATLILISCAVMVAIAAFCQSNTMQSDGNGNSFDYRKKESDPVDDA